jgi:hypothetical protein
LEEGAIEKRLGSFLLNFNTMEKLSLEKFKKFENARLLNTRSVMGGSTTTSSTPPDKDSCATSNDISVKEDKQQV